MFLRSFTSFPPHYPDPGGFAHNARMRSLLVCTLFLLPSVVHATCGAILTERELLKVDSPATRQMRHYIEGRVFVHLEWDGHESSHVSAVKELLREDDTTRATWPAIPLVPIPELGQPRHVRVMVRSARRPLPVILEGELAAGDGHMGPFFGLRLNVKPEWREGEPEKPQPEEVIAVYTALSAMPYVSRLSFSMQINDRAHADFTTALRRELAAGVPEDEAVAPFMGFAIDFALTRSPLVKSMGFALLGFSGEDRVPAPSAEDFHVIYNFQLEGDAYHPVSSLGETKH